MKDQYLHLAFLVRTSPAKGIDRAIEISEPIGMAIKIAAEVEAAGRAYCQGIIASLLAYVSM